MAKELAFHQGRHERTAIHGNERHRRQGAAEMNGARHKLFSRAAFARDKDRRANVLESRNHPQHILNFRRRAGNPIQLGSRIHTLAQKLIFSDQTDFFRHPLQQLAQFFHAKRLLDVVVRALPHGFHGRLDRAVPGHDGDLGARQHLFDFSQQVRAGKAGQFQIADDDIGRRGFHRRQRRLGCLRFGTHEIQTLAHRHAEAADALFIVHDQKAKPRLVFHGFPMVFSTAAISS